MVWLFVIDHDKVAPFITPTSPVNSIHYDLTVFSLIKVLK